MLQTGKIRLFGQRKTTTKKQQKKTNNNNQGRER
jgi:hypothetical protein